MKCIHCGTELKERVRKIYLDGEYTDAMIKDHQHYCPKCGWWKDGLWEVFEGKLKQLTLEEVNNEAI